MGSVALEGFGSGGAALNFRVVGNPQPANPKENTIWVNTDVKITGWVFASAEPEAPADGMVWISTGASSSVEFNALKKNGIQVYPLSAKQYISGAWVGVSIKVYKDGTWTTPNTIPAFNYTGDFEIVNDYDETITISHDNWKIRFLTSGTLTFTELNGAINGIDIFCVGGGGGGSSWGSGGYITGGGGGGGYTTTATRHVAADMEYDIVIGAGGGTSVNGTDGGQTSAFDVKASGGKGSIGGQYIGGAGGSGGGGRNDTDIAGGGKGGYDGGNGSAGGKSAGGAGQGTTTREFGEATGASYAGGGAGAGASWATNDHSPSDGGGGDATGNAVANTGGGGRASGAGASGIVVIRNKRGEA